MLASLLPGLRDVRVPLTLGYLWLLNIWLWFSGALPDSRPKSGLAGRAVELGDLLGPAGILAAASFGAYVLGALVQLPAAVALSPRLQSAILIRSSDSRSTAAEYLGFLANLNDRIEEKSRNMATWEYEEVSRDVQQASHATVDELRPRLLVANQDLFGEYDRLASEGQFRFNIAWPLLALGVTAGAELSWWWVAPGGLICFMLIIQGLRKTGQSVSVVQRAVLSNLITHPLQSILNRWG